MAERQPLEKFEYEARKPADFEVEVAITHCGICYDDIHMIDDEAGLTVYPFVPGHEIVGRVSRLGGKVEAFEKDDRVGIGWQARSCGRCEWCVRGEENLCCELLQTATWSPYGGVATFIVVDSRFAFSLPESLESEMAAPLMCGGVAVYSALRKHARPAMKVGVVGIGGLGHMALQFAGGFGCEVTAFSSSPAKQEDVRDFGANCFIDFRDVDRLENMARSMDLIIFLAQADADWNAYLGMLRPNGKMCLVGVPPNTVSFAPLPLILGQLSVCGSVIGSRSDMCEMLEFAARHEVKAQVEVMPMPEVNQAIAKLKANRARYRIVLKN